MDTYRPDGGRVLLGPMLTEGQVARRLNVDRSYIRTRPFLTRVAGRICLGPAYPSWLFGPRGVIPEVALLAWLLKRRMGDLDACDWLVRGHEALHGASPIEWLSAGHSLDSAIAALPWSGDEASDKPRLEEARRAWLSFAATR